MPVFDPVWAINGLTRNPSVSEEDQGFACGAADRELFNFLFQDLQQAINALWLGNGRSDIPVNGWQSAPPGSPATGDRYIVLPTGSGPFAGHDNEIAMWTGAEWAFAEPATGILANYSNGTTLVPIYFTGSAWRIWSAAVPNVSVFTSSGTFVAPAGVTRAKVTVVGGGASGGSTGQTLNQAGGGGGAGGWAIAIVNTLSPGDCIPVTVGSGGPSAAGSAASTGNPGTNGGASSFGAYCSATGGLAGAGAAVSDQPGGAGGQGAGGYINGRGGSGHDGTSAAGVTGSGGGGGDSLFGGAGRAARAASSLLQAGGAPGAGGGSGYQTLGTASGAGANGIVIVEW